MATDALVAIQSELAQIKWVLVLLSVVVTIVAVFAIIRAYFRVASGMRSFLEDRFTREAADLFDQDKLKEVKALAEQTLAERPNHSHARWYLARVLHLERNYDASLREFSELRRRFPSWKVDYIDPYVREIEQAQTRNEFKGGDR